jgi:hypothetical protein
VRTSTAQPVEIGEPHLARHVLGAGSMFARVLAIAILSTSAVAHGGSGSGDDETQPTISAKDLKKYFEPYIPSVRDCYVANAQGHGVDGNLRLELIIHRDGTVFRFGFEAPGVTGGALRKLDSCLRALSETWHLPVRRGFTTAVLPFYFQRTLAPGAGPGGR